MDIQEIQEKFEDLLLANPDFDEGFLEKDEEGSYSDSDIQHMYSMFEAGTEVGAQWQAAKAQAVPEGFVWMPKEPTQNIYRTFYDAFNSADAGNTAQNFKVAYKAMIKAQEPAND